MRQSEALFRHVVNLPSLIENVIDEVRSAGGRVGAVGVSSAPRPEKGSYMPVFCAGVTAASALAAGADCPLHSFSHQEGHIMAVKDYSPLRHSPDHISIHLSGGTTELLRVRGTDTGMEVEICGGTDDIPFGQLLDRVGLKMGFPFPGGAEVDRLAIRGGDMEERDVKTLLPRIKLRDGHINLSGIETASLRLIDRGADKRDLSEALMYRVSEAIASLAVYGCERYGLSQVILAGGVSSSLFLRGRLGRILDDLKRKKSGVRPEIYFGDPDLSSDNAVGTALLAAYTAAGRFPWQ